MGIKKSQKNRIRGAKREVLVLKELETLYPEEQGYSIFKQVSLRDSNGKVVKDEVTGESRRLDYIVLLGKDIIASIEVTSETASKVKQLEKEGRIRENGGNHVAVLNEVIKISVTTEIWRRI